MKMLTLVFSLLSLFAGDFPYRAVQPNPNYRFPRDHFEHPEYRTEWWYYTGNLHTRDGHPYGFELVFFRVGERALNTTNTSAWRVDDLYMAHAALTDLKKGTFHSMQRLNRAGPGIAGASFAQQRIWNGNWQSLWKGTTQELTALTDDFQFQFVLTPVKPLVIHGLHGISQKGEGAGHASYYLSFPRLAVTGSLQSEGKTEGITGEAWMDHEWFTERLDPSQIGWNWFSVQLENGTELMLYDMRRKNGNQDPYSSGTLIYPSGKTTHLRSADFSLRPLRYWTSARNGAHYPVEWEIWVPTQHIHLICKAVVENQELSTGTTERDSYWEGAVTYSGTHTGKGYLEMTGYYRPISFGTDSTHPN